MTHINRTKTVNLDAAANKQINVEKYIIIAFCPSTVFIKDHLISLAIDKYLQSK